MGHCIPKPNPRNDAKANVTPNGGNTANSNNNTKLTAEPVEQPKEVKLLLLGAGESGKSTVWKQMKMIHVEGFDENERDMHYKPAIVENVVQLLQSYIQIARKNNLDLSGEYQDLITKLTETEAVYQDIKDFCPQLLALWGEKAVMEVANSYSNQLSLELVDTASYWIEHHKRILQDNYIPTVEDIIKCRTKTTGIQDLCFEMDGVEFRLIDVGGQRSERKKWISCFQNLTAILFVVALSEFDQKLREDSDVNRMQESMKLFKGVVANEALHHVHMILFFNKDDIFREKIKRSQLSATFPDYTGDNDYESAHAFIKEKFTSMNTNAARTIHTQTTVATDIENIRQVMDEVRDILLTARKAPMSL